MKKILGLDLGTTSIGWAYVKEAESENEESSIIRTGVRIVPLTSDESDNFTKGKSVSVNAERTVKRGARRNLDRYQLRRKELLRVLEKNGFINDSTMLAEDGKGTTHSLWKLRARAVEEEISLEEFARVLLTINKKRGYKSNRKVVDESEGQAVDTMEIAKHLYNNELTPGQYVYERLTNGKRNIPDFYRSDLRNEFDKIWENQKNFYNDVLTNELKEEIKGKSKGQTWKICEKPFNIVGIKLEGNKEEIRLKQYQLRVKGLSEQISLEYLAIVLQEINNQINSSSGYLGEISDRSKELYFRNLTIGQYLYRQIKENKHTRLKNQVFYRQDYLDEFERIWEKQSQYHNELTTDLKIYIRDVVIFYQRRLKSQKGLVSICEFEGKEVEIEIDGVKRMKRIGPRVIPRSSPLFQEFKIWQIINNIEVRNLITQERYTLDKFGEDIRQLLFSELNIKERLSNKSVLKLLRLKPNEWELNFRDGIEGNKTNAALYKAYQKILDISGHEIELSEMNAEETKEAIAGVFGLLGINREILDFDAELDGKFFEQQPLYQLWHMLYSYEGDNSQTGNDALYRKLEQRFCFAKEYAKPLVAIAFQGDYGSLSAKAIRKIIPYLKAGHEYSEAAALAGYRHSKQSLTKEEIENKQLQKHLELLPKNSLRNPVVEKILNQMVNVVNAIIDLYGKPDVIRIELARELKKNASEREEMTYSINKANREHDNIRDILKELYPFNTGVRITRNDVIKYKLYQELASIGYKTIYTNTYVPLEKLFSKEFDIEHIIPKALLFDDSFSNKTIAVRDFNRVKSKRTGIDAVVEKYGENSKGVNEYMNRIESLFKDKVVSKAKYNKLKMKESDIPDGFIERDLRESQYIAKKAKQMLEEVVRHVETTTGSVTDRLRGDWQFVNVLQELNWEKYKRLGLTDYEKNKDGDQVPKIKDWTKRNDHRHHAMDAITVAFTRHSHIQYLNNLNAKSNEKNERYHAVYGIEQKETYKNENGERLIKPPIPLARFRSEAKEQLENTLISFKAKNKVVTRNKNKTKKKGGYNTGTELTPRGQLHKETVYGVSRQYVTKDEKVGSKFDEAKIMQVAKRSYRDALLKRLRESDNNPKKAFSGRNAPSKNPIYLDEHQSSKLPEKVKLVLLEERYTIRKDITPVDFKTQKNIEKVIDVKLRKILSDRLRENGNDPQKAFANLEENPIWVNKEKGIQMKRVCITGVSNAEPLHAKKDHFGNEIIDNEGQPVPVDYVSTGNNHHVAVYRDENGNLHEEVVSFFEAVARVNAGTPVIWYKHPENPDWKFLFTMKQNEMFIFLNKETGFDPNEIDLTDDKNYHLISPNLYRVQKIATKNYVFNHHLETQAVSGEILKKKELSNITYKFIQTPANLDGIMKVRIDHIGRIKKVGE